MTLASHLDSPTSSRSSSPHRNDVLNESKSEPVKQSDITPIIESPPVADINPIIIPSTEESSSISDADNLTNSDSLVADNDSSTDVSAEQVSEQQSAPESHQQANLETVTEAQQDVEKSEEHILTEQEQQTNNTNDDNSTPSTTTSSLSESSESSTHENVTTASTSENTNTSSIDNIHVSSSSPSEPNCSIGSLPQMKKIDDIHIQIITISEKIDTLISLINNHAALISGIQWKTKFINNNKSLNRSNYPQTSQKTLLTSNSRLLYDIGMCDENLMSKIFLLDAVEINSEHKYYNQIKQHRKSTIIYSKHLIKKTENLKKRIKWWKQTLVNNKWFTQQEINELKEKEKQEILKQEQEKIQEEIKKAAKAKLEAEIQLQQAKLKEQQLQNKQQLNSSIQVNASENSNQTSDIPIAFTNSQFSMNQQKQLNNIYTTNKSSTNTNTNNSSNTIKPVNTNNNKPLISNNNTSSPVVQQIVKQLPHSCSALSNPSNVTNSVSSQPSSSTIIIQPNSPLFEINSTSNKSNNSSCSQLPSNPFFNRYSHLNLPHYEPDLQQINQTNHIKLLLDIDGIKRNDLQILVNSSKDLNNESAELSLLIRGIKLPSKQQFHQHTLPFTMFGEIIVQNKNKNQDYGWFEKQLIIPTEYFSIEHAKVSINNGMLQIILPKKQTQQRKILSINNNHLPISLSNFIPSTKQPQPRSQRKGRNYQYYNNDDNDYNVEDDDQTYDNFIPQFHRPTRNTSYYPSAGVHPNVSPIHVPVNVSPFFGVPVSCSSAYSPYAYNPQSSPMFAPMRFW